MVYQPDIVMKRVIQLFKDKINKCFKSKCFSPHKQIPQLLTYLQHLVRGARSISHDNRIEQSCTKLNEVREHALLYVISPSVHPAGSQWSLSQRTGMVTLFCGQ